MNGSDIGIASFGRLRLSPATREIEKDGVPIALGDRALDILIVLVEHAGEIVSHRELISRVWRGLVVSPGNLRVHMSALRKALGDGHGGARYIANVVGQGYTFVAPVRRSYPTLRTATLASALGLTTRTQTRWRYQWHFRRKHKCGCTEKGVAPVQIATDFKKHAAASSSMSAKKLIGTASMLRSERRSMTCGS
jgi:DNA-binding winged helix-turn-helix (wHTH) protein